MSTQALEDELENRELKAVFPLEVFHPAIKPFIQLLHKELDLPRPYIGLAMLTAYSSAIGTAYAIKSGQDHMYLPVWGCMEGMSSSGKSLALNMILRPLQKLQLKLDREWDQDVQYMTPDEIRHKHMEVCMFRDVHMATLTRTVMPDNPKGVTKMADEILEWINGMNSLSKKEGTDEQFWLSTWDCAPYSGIRSGKDKFTLPRPFVNVVGGVQPSVTYKLFAKDRDVTGFIFRLLFAVPPQTRIAQPNSMFTMPSELEDLHAKALMVMYNNLKVEDGYQEPKVLTFTAEAAKEIEIWRTTKVVRINHMTEPRDKEIHAGILGKIYTYAKRFAALLKIADRVYERGILNEHLVIDIETVDRALKLAEYFYESAAIVSDRVQTKVTAPAHILRWASMVQSGLSFHEMGLREYRNQREVTPDAGAKRMSRNIKKAIKEYPNVFKATEKK